MKKLSLFCLMMVLLVLVPFVPVLAESADRADSGVGIGFEGEWVEPEGMMPELPPFIPEGMTPELPVVPQPPTQPPRLPPTGGVHDWFLVGAGLLLLAGIGLVFRSRRKQGALLLAGGCALGGLLVTGHSNVLAASSQTSTGRLTLSQGPVEPDEGRIEIQYVTDLSFGVMEITNLDAVYYALPYQGYESEVLDAEADQLIANFIRVLDDRPGRSPWMLQARKNGQLTAAGVDPDHEHFVLNGAELSIVDSYNVTDAHHGGMTVWNVTFDPGGALHNVKQADEGHLCNISYKVFGSLEEVEGTLRNTGVQLFVPGSTPRGAFNYTTSITWILSDIVEN